MRPGNEVAGLPGLPRSRLFEPRSREAPTSPPLAFKYGSRLSSLLFPLGTFHQEGGHNWLGDHTRNRKDTTFKVIFLESEISQFLFKSFHIRSLHKEKQCLFFFFPFKSLIFEGYYTTMLIMVSSLSRSMRLKETECVL